VVSSSKVRSKQKKRKEKEKPDKEKLVTCGFNRFTRDVVLMIV